MSNAARRCDRRVAVPDRPQQRRRSDPRRPQSQPDGSDGARRQAGAGRPRGLARRRQCKGRAARPAGRARLLRRSGEPRERAGHLREASVGRQGRPADRSVQHQRDRGRAAGDHAGEPHHHRHLRARREQRVQVSEVLLDELAGRQPAQLFGRLLRDGEGAPAETDSRRARRRRRRVLAQRDRRRARKRQGNGLRDRLRAQLSGRRRSVADRAGDAGDQSRHRLCGDAAAGHGRPDPRLERDPVQAEALRRRIPRPAHHRHQAAARARSRTGW